MGPTPRVSGPLSSSRGAGSGSATWSESPPQPRSASNRRRCRPTVDAGSPSRTGRAIRRTSSRNTATFRCRPTCAVPTTWPIGSAIRRSTRGRGEASPLPPQGLHFTAAAPRRSARRAASRSPSWSSTWVPARSSPSRPTTSPTTASIPNRSSSPPRRRMPSSAHSRAWRARHRRRDDRHPRPRNAAPCRAVWCDQGPVRPISWSCPATASRAVDGLITNFHLPRSSLLLLVAAFAGRERVSGRLPGGDRARLPLLQLRRRHARRLRPRRYDCRSR